MKRVFLYGAAGGALLVLLQLLEYQHFVRTVPTAWYGGAIGVLFTGLGVWAGLRWRGRPEVVVVREVLVPRETTPPAAGPFAADAARISELGVTPRELEVLGLIAQGLSNRQIGERIFVSENTVKTHSSRLFDKLDARNRVQAVKRGKELGLIP